jgi:hypothetical protein
MRCEAGHLILTKDRRRTALRLPCGCPLSSRVARKAAGISAGALSKLRAGAS